MRSTVVLNVSVSLQNRTIIVYPSYSVSLGRILCIEIDIFIANCIVILYFFTKVSIKVPSTELMSSLFRRVARKIYLTARLIIFCLYLHIVIVINVFNIECCCNNLRAFNFNFTIDMITLICLIKARNLKGF